MSTFTDLLFRGDSGVRNLLQGEDDISFIDLIARIRGDQITPSDRGIGFRNPNVTQDGFSIFEGKDPRTGGIETELRKFLLQGAAAAEAEQPPPVLEEETPTEPIPVEPTIEPEEPAPTEPLAKPVAAEPEKEEDTGGFLGGLANFAQKAGLVAAGLAAAKGNTNPLELILAAKIGRNAAKKQAAQIALEAEKTKSTTASTKAKTELDRQRIALDKRRLEIDWFKAQKTSNPNLQYKEIEIDGVMVPHTFDPDTGKAERLTIPGFDPQARNKSEDTNVDGILWTRVTDPLGNTVSFGPTKVIEPEIMVGDDGFKIKRRWLEDGLERFDVILTDRGQRDELRRQMQDNQDVSRAFLNTINQDAAVKDAKTIEDSYGKLLSTMRLLAEGKITDASGTIAIINQFQRMIDPATVRTGDIELIQNASTRYENLMIELARTFKATGVIPPRTVADMLEIATSFVESTRSRRDDVIDSHLKNANIPGLNTPEAIAILNEQADNIRTLGDANVDPDIIRSMLNGHDSDKAVQEQVRQAEAARDINKLLALQRNGSLLAQEALIRLKGGK